MLNKKEKYLTLEEAGAVIGMSAAAVYSWCRKGRLTYYQYSDSSKMMITEKDLEAFLIKSKRAALLN